MDDGSYGLRCSEDIATGYKPQISDRYVRVYLGALTKVRSENYSIASKYLYSAHTRPSQATVIM